MDKIRCETGQWNARDDTNTLVSNISTGLKKANQSLIDIVGYLSSLDLQVAHRPRLSVSYTSQNSQINALIDDVRALEKCVGLMVTDINDLDQRLNQDMNDPVRALSIISWDDLSTPNTVGVTDPSGHYVLQIKLDDLFDRVTGGDFATSSTGELSDIAAAKLKELQATADDLADKISVGWKMTDKDWQTLIDLSDSQYAEIFGGLFYGDPRVTPELVAKRASELSEKYVNIFSSGQSAEDSPIVAMKVNQYQAKLIALGELLGAATRAEHPTLSEDFDDQVIAVFKAKPPSRLPVAMSVILSNGTYSHDFALSVAESVYDYERSNGKTWGEIAGDGPVHMGGMGLYMYDTKGRELTDAMAGVMAMLGSNSKAAQDFFTGGDDRTTVTVDGTDITFSSRLQYLTIDRVWGNINGSDEGDGLGAALLAATTGLRFECTDEQAKTSAQLATLVLNLIGQHTAQDDDWEMYMDMRDDVAHIVASYMPDQFDMNTGIAYNHGHLIWADDGFYRNPSDDFPGFPPGAVFTQSNMDALMQTLGKDFGNLSIVGAGWAVTNQVFMAHRLESHYLVDDPTTPEIDESIGRRAGVINGSDDQCFRDSILAGAEVLSNIMDQAVAGNKELAADEAAKQKMESEILGLALSLPVPGLDEALGVGKWVDWAYKQGKKEATTWVDGQIVAQNAGTLNADKTRNYNDELGNNAMDATVQMMYDMGFWDQKVTDAAGSPRSVPPDNAFIGDAEGPKTTFDTQPGGYTEWLKNNSGIYDTTKSAFQTAYGVTIDR